MAENGADGERLVEVARRACFAGWHEPEIAVRCAPGCPAYRYDRPTVVRTCARHASLAGLYLASQGHVGLVAIVLRTGERTEVVT